MPHHHVPSSAVASFIDPDRLSRVLAPWIPDDGDRAFIIRCMTAEGPAHHRGANYVLLALLGEVVQRVGVQPHGEGNTLPVPMKLPPHLRTAGVAQADYPVGLPESAVARLAALGSRDFDAMVDCLTDGPPQHALANVTMVTLLDALLHALEPNP